MATRTYVGLRISVEAREQVAAMAAAEGVAWSVVARRLLDRGLAAELKDGAKKASAKA
jgi:hypothetical protein